MHVRGRNLVSGLPVNIEITSEEIMDALEENIASIADAIHSVLERTPPEMASDIADQGIIMTGGGALLYGLDEYVQKRMGIPVTVAEDAISCVAKGTGKALNSIHVLAQARGQRSRQER